MRLYEYVKFSYPFHLYEKLCKPDVAKEAYREIQFYKSFLQPCDLIFDIGANDGHKAEAFLHLAERVVCCEPDEKNFWTLEIRFRTRKSRVYLEKLAIGSKKETTCMYIHKEGSAFNTLNEKFKNVLQSDTLEKWNEKIKFHSTSLVEVDTLEAMIKKYGKPFFIKIDVEGYELEVIKGLDQPIPYLSLECLFPDFRKELDEVLHCIARLDPEPEYNIAVQEKLLFEKFISAEELGLFLTAYSQNHFELIVKMHPVHS